VAIKKRIEWRLQVQIAFSMEVELAPKGNSHAKMDCWVGKCRLQAEISAAF
jgi:hypothetical protein